ncbi:MAG: glycerol kinase GlpK [Clostridia bacterium]|nr:glycerol kinase GlpK [Clostridia bacterium]
MMPYIISADCGTTGTRAMLYDLRLNKFVGASSMPITQIYPRPAWVEQNAAEIFGNTLAAVISQIDAAPSEKDILSIGITNQRETVVAWDRRTGKPAYNAIVWQCRRTADFCESIRDKADLIRERTGLVVDPYFSASKIRWLLDNVPEVRSLLKEGNLCVGTVDSYIIFRLTEGKSFVTDVTNASRTMLFNIKTLSWDDDLLRLFGIPKSILPEVKSCTDKMGDFIFRGRKIPIAGVAGDQQAALVGQAALDIGKGKITYGTGMFMLLSTGDKIAYSKCGMVSTIGCSFGEKVVYALEGSVFNAGSAVQWLRDELGFFSASKESEEFALKAEDTGGVYFVPAFTGLGAPYWNSDARAAFTGISRGTNKYHLTRAVLESIAYSAKDLAANMCADSGVELTEIGCDGGASQNDFLMQFQSDVLGVKLVRPVERESTALGAAYLSAVAMGEYSVGDIAALRRIDRTFTPSPDTEKFEKLYAGYKKAVEKCLL